MIRTVCVLLFCCQKRAFSFVFSSTKFTPRRRHSVNTSMSDNNNDKTPPSSSFDSTSFHLFETTSIIEQQHQPLHDDNVSTPPTILTAAAAAEIEIASSSSRSLSLPDLNDVSMNQLKTYLQYSTNDLYWSFWSDVLFIVGSIGYLILSISSSEEVVLEWATPIIFVFNSMVDVAWAQSSRKRNKIKDRVTETWKFWQLLLDDSIDDNAALTSEEEEDDELQHDGSFFSRFLLLCKHDAHRRTTLAAMLFGGASLCAVLALPTTNDYTATMFDFLSVHLYILSAIVAISGERTRPWLSTTTSVFYTTTTDQQQNDGSTFSRTVIWHPETLEDLGDLLFLVASVGDGILCDFHFDDDVPFWKILSALLWLLDASLYLCADIIMAQWALHAKSDKRAGNGGTLV